MPVKHEIDGETYIVSEDVDLDQLDLEQMVDKSDLSKIGDVLESSLARLQAPAPDAPTIAPAPKQERIWLQLNFSAGEEETTLSGFIEEMHSTNFNNDGATFCKIRTDRKQAFEFSMFCMRAGNAKIPATLTAATGYYGELESPIGLNENGHFGISSLRVCDPEASDTFILVEFQIDPIGATT